MSARDDIMRLARAEAMELCSGLPMVVAASYLASGTRTDRFDADELECAERLRVVHCDRYAVILERYETPPDAAMCLAALIQEAERWK